MTVIIFFIVLWYFSLFCQTFFQHRYAAHGMFKMSKGWEKFFYIFTFITQGSSYLSPYAYGVLHRLHHAYTDTENDPHSPSYTKGLFPLMLKTRVIYQEIFNGKFPVEEKYLKNLPQWRSFDLFASNILTRITWGIVYIVFFYFFATAWWMWLLLPFIFVMGPLHGAIINYFAHKYGYRNFSIEDTSKNILPLDLIMMGEGYHNNHHKHMGRANFGVRWFEFDPTYPVIVILAKLGVIQMNRA
ncbi:MAG: acyl-CoA desaturase [Bacteroidetes bacterium]|nr:acyl-CoA desaturase [Bacteroidota bacterium]MBP7398754.1 acyl-CoA desaturase [Chitinophagales bacterium]MBK7109703.1 acyl-CoA desaturase [Bacteroidota bacterium]MBK8487558.1 acyl-CoA desaturase [Bacteroidota bacterium]MBP8753755.1 acyl-CoA desaturase [Chitinophagales bacterium]